VLESCQLAFHRDGHAFEKSVEADAPTLRARRIYASEGRWTQGAGALTARRVLTVRA
jgi:hypothetical protein